MTNLNILRENIYQLTQMLEKISDFDFDIFKFDEICENNSLYYYTFELFGKYEFFSNINEEVFNRFINMIKDGYPRKNSYHNDLHATDVLQTCVTIFEKGNFIQVNLLIFLFISY
jgi:hypothetical protein